MSNVTLLQKKELADLGIVAELEKWLELAKAGEIVSMVGAVELKDARMYEFKRLNCTYEQAVALYTRATYKLKREWDMPQ